MKRKYRVTTNSNHLYPVNENLLLRDFSTTSTGEKWVSDITYIRTGEGWLYLTMVLDLADRKIKHKLPKMSLLFCCNSSSTAKTLSENFGKISQAKDSMSINSSDTSTTKATQMDYAIPASKIATLSSGEFVGVVADNPEQKIKLKMFHAEIQNDHGAMAREEVLFKEIPMVKVVTGRWWRRIISRSSGTFLSC